MVETYEFQRCTKLSLESWDEETLRNTVSESELLKKKDEEETSEFMEEVHSNQKVKKTGSAKHIARLGRPRVTSARDDRKIIRAVKANPKISTRELKETLCLPVAEQTIKNRLNDACFFERRARNKTFINKINKKKLLEFAHTYLNYPVEFWRKVLITDASRFELRSDTRKKIKFWHQKNKAFEPKNVQPTVKSGYKSVLVWMLQL